MQCRFCGSNDIREEILTNSVHYGKYICNNCGENLDWIKKPKNINSKKRKVTPLKENVNYCQICLRTKDKLGNDNSLTEHHILPYNIFPEFDEYKDNRLVVCSRCHEAINLIQRMFNTFNNMELRNAIL